ncbi:diguanylate cyclase [Pseudooceanicola pacificus]|nr:diguanylate cyclase [Pseudooceanicola pacificus]
MDAVLTTINGTGLMAMVAVLYGLVQRVHLPRWQRHALLGLAFGFGAAAGMMEPLQLAPGNFMDCRNLFIGFAGVFAGPIGAGIAFVVGAAARLAIGGPGAIYGVISMYIAGLLGLMWVLKRLRPDVMKSYHFTIIGAHISLSFGAMFFLPTQSGFQNVVETLPAFIVFNIVAATVFGTLINRERERARKERLLTEKADTDFLTGSLNRQGLERRYSATRALGTPKGAALLLFDLDHFKQVNDNYGHGVGDDVLADTVQTIRSRLRPGDIFARVGGEEFLILLQDVTRDTAHRKADKLRQAVCENVIIVDAPEREVTISVGVAHYRTDLPDLSEAMKAADALLYVAKDTGRNRVVAATIPYPVRGSRPASGAMPGPYLVSETPSG